MARFQDVDFAGIATETDEELKSLKEKWMTILDQTDQTDPQNRFRTGLLRMAFSYARLVSLSFAFQHTFGRHYDNENPFLLRVRLDIECFACNVLIVMTVLGCCIRRSRRDHQ